MDQHHEGTRKGGGDQDPEPLTRYCSSLIKYEDCEASYVGETGRLLKTRFQEYQRPRIVSSKVSIHVNMDHPEHRVKLDTDRIHAVEPRWYEKEVKEVIEICMVKPSLNKDEGRFNLPTV